VQPTRAPAIMGKDDALPSSGKMAGMKADSRLAVFCLVCFAILIAGIMVEKYWDCRLRTKLSQNECLFTPAPYTVP